MAAVELQRDAEGRVAAHSRHPEAVLRSERLILPTSARPGDHNEYSSCGLPEIVEEFYRDLRSLKEHLSQASNTTSQIAAVSAPHKRKKYLPALAWFLAGALVTGSAELIYASGH